MSTALEVYTQAATFAANTGRKADASGTRHYLARYAQALQAQEQALAALDAVRDDRVQGLVAALEALLEQADMGKVSEETQPIVDQARAAIAAARGAA